MMIYFRGTDIKTGKLIESQKVNLAEYDGKVLFYVDDRWRTVDADSVEIVNDTESGRRMVCIYASDKESVLNIRETPDD